MDYGVLWPNGWMDQDTTEVDLGHGHILLCGDLPPRKGHSTPSALFDPSIEAKRSTISATAEHLSTFLTSRLSYKFIII